MKEMVKGLFKKFGKKTEDEPKYILVYMDCSNKEEPKTHFIVKNNLNEIYTLLTEAKFQQGTYQLIKGNLFKSSWHVKI